MSNRKNLFGTRMLCILMSFLMVITSIPALSIFALAEELSGDEIANEPRYELNFNKNWKFNYGDVANAQSTAYSDKAWSDVSLPHDFSIIQDFTLSGTEGESGSLPGGTGWYRKSFILPQSVHDRVFILNFGASYQETTVYVNGTKIGENFNGYNSFSFDISDYLYFDGVTQNIIAVKVVNNIPSSRWYSGSGLIGDVTLSVLRNVHVGLYGTQITTPDLESSNGTDGTTTVKVEIHNDSSATENINVVADILNSSGTVVATANQSLSISGNTTKAVTLTAEVSSPALWSVDTPNMYKARIRVEENGEALDEYYTDFGYTWSSWNQTTGFSLNGQNLKLQGVCMHLDQGGLGAVQEYDAIYRQLSILKGMGVNAIRGSHNVFPEMYIDICNELGILFMEEMFDGWIVHKNDNSYDFATCFDTSIASDNHIFGGSGLKWYQFVVTQTIKRDRNNPCIFAWDVANELWNPNQPTIASDLKNIIDSLDSRPMLWGNNSGSKQSIDSYMDIFGGNYHLSDYLSKYSSFGMPFVGSETASVVGSRGYYKNLYSQNAYNVNYAGSYQVNAYDASNVSWGNTAADAWYYTIINDWFSGEFVWTGFDYIGEPTPWNGHDNTYVKTDINGPNSSFFGIIDTAGFGKDSYYLYNSWWDKNETTLHLVPGTWNSSNLVVDSSGYVDVAIYTSAPYVELLYNGNVIAKATGTTYTTSAGYRYTTYAETVVDSSKCKVGTLTGSNDHNLYPLFEVKYDASAELTLKAYKSEGGAEITDTVGTKKVYANTASNITVGAWNDDTTLTADGDSFNYIEVTAVDSNGNFVNDYNGTLDVTLTSSSGAGVIAAVDNGNASTNDKFQSSTSLLSDTTARIKMFNGKALIIVQSTEKAGKINVTVAPTDLPSQSIGLTSVAEVDDELTDEFEEIFDQTVDVSNLDNQARFEFLEASFNDLDEPVEDVSYVLYTLGSGAVSEIPTGYYIISGSDSTGNISTGSLSTTSAGAGTLVTEGSEIGSNSRVWTFTKQDNGKYYVSFTGEFIIGEYLNISASGLSTSATPQELDVIFSDGKVKIGDGTNYITYSSSSANTAGVSTSGTALKLYQVKDGEVERFGDVGLVEDGQYIIYGTSSWTNTSGYVMTPKPTVVNSFNGLEQSAATPSGNEIVTDSANEWTFEKIEDSTGYTIKSSDGKYLNIDSSGNAKLYLSDSPVATRIRQYNSEQKVIIDVDNYVLDLYGDGLFSQYIQSNMGLIGDNERFELYRKVDASSAADIALYNALENALNTNPAAYEDESYANLLDAVQAGLEKYGKDTVSDAEKTAAAEAINSAFDALEKNAISPTLKEDIAGLQAPVSIEGGYFKYKAVSGTPIPDGQYILYATDKSNSSNVMSGNDITASTGVKGFERSTGTVSGEKITTAESNEWTITYNSSTGKYTFKNVDDEYLNVQQARNSVTASSTPIELSISPYSDGTVNIHNSNFYLQNHDTKAAPIFSNWDETTGNQVHCKFTLYREQEAYDATNKKALYDALQMGAEAEQELYTNATYTALLQAMQNGYDVFTDDSATDAEIISATQAINKAYDALKYLNLRPLLESQIAALTPPPGSQAQYGRYTAKQTSATVIPDGEYVISLDFDNRGTNGCWGVMSNTYVLEDGWTWDGMGWAATGAAPNANSDTWLIQRDTSSGNYLISRLNADGEREYLYIPNAGNNDNCEMSATTSYSGKAAYWSAEIDTATGLVKFRNTTSARSDHLITFCAQEAYDSNLIDGSLYVSAYQEGAISGKNNLLRLQRKENGQLVEWYAPVADGRYLITQLNVNDTGVSNTTTNVMNTTSVPVAGSFAQVSNQQIVNDKITTNIDYELVFELVDIASGTYYIKTNTGKYISIGNSGTTDATHKSYELTLSDTPMALYVDPDENGNVYIYREDGSASNDADNIYLDHYVGDNRFSSWKESRSGNKALRLFSYEQMVSENTVQQALYKKLQDAIAIDQGNYSEESYNKLLLAIMDGIDSYNNDTTDDEWQASIDKIDSAIAALEIAKTSFPATIYKYGYTPTSTYTGGGKDFNEITYMEMFDVIYATPKILDQIKAVIGYDTATWASSDEKNAALEAVVYEYAKLYSIAFTGFPVASDDKNTKVTNLYDTFWNIWDKPNTKGSNEQINDGASVQGLFSTTLGADGLPESHAAYDDALPYINTDVTMHTNVTNRAVSGIHENITKDITRNGSTSTITLTPLEDISVYAPDFFSREAILSSGKLGNPSATYAKQYWDVQFPFVEYTNMFGVNTYVYDSSDTERVFQASYNDSTHTATAQLTEIDSDSDLGKVRGPNDWSNGRGFFPFNNRLDGSNASMTTTEAAVYHFGMSFSTDFYIPSTGQYGDGNDIVFEFSGDDDVLVYIDDVLVLDNGGLHGPRYANINFTKKSVSYQFLSDVESGAVLNPGSEGITYTYGAENAGISAQNQAAIEYLNKVATDGQQHTFTFYYLERGSTDSNCKLMFNIQKISDYVKLNDQSYVVDFGLPVEFDVKENNVVTAPEGYEFATYNYVGITNRVPASANSLVMFNEPTADEVTRFGSKTQLEYAGNFGTYIINKDGTVKYTPKTIQFTDAGSIYLCAKVEHDPTYKEGTVYYAFEKITIIPATTIYYEDDFEGNGVTYTDGTIPTDETNNNKYGIWQDATNSLPTGVIKGEIYQHADKPGAVDSNAYGYDSAYDECAMYSGYSSKYVTVSTKNNPNVTYSGGAGSSWPKAEFTFAGTGFDLISVTSKDTGAINLTVKNSDGKVVKNHTVNTYYGYTYGQIYRAVNGSETLTVTNTPLYFTADRSYTATPTYYAADGTIVTENTGDLEPAYAMGWILETAVTEDNALYQIPVMKINALDYGVYTVTVTPMYSSRMDMQKDGAYEFYFDAIRIYNPAGVGDTLVNPTISYTYTQDKEANPDYLELRNMLISTNKLTNDGTSAEGVVFIDGVAENDDVSKYTSGGPNNELYLLKDQAVAFQIWASSVPDDIQIGAKAVGEKVPTMFVSYATTTDMYTAQASVKSATDLSYSIDALLRQQSEGQLGWTPVTGSDGNTYYSSGTIVIQNITDGIISITNVKWTFPSAGFGYFENLENSTQAVSEEPVMLMSNYSTFRMARSAVRATNADLEIGQDDVVVENNTVATGEAIKINVSTSTDVDTLIIRDENGNVVTPEAIESYVETIDNEKVKQWTVTLSADKAGSYTYTITGAYENGYESDTPVEITVTVEDVPETEENGDDEFSILDAITGYFAKLVDFFKKIIAILTSMFA